MTTNSLYFLDLEGSTLKKKLLGYYFTNPKKHYYVRELAVHLNVDPTNLSKELRRLEKNGVFISEKQGNLKYFSLNFRYPLYQELKSMIFKTIGVKGAIQQLLGKTPGIKRAFIYGSFAKKSERADSDIDLCLVVAKKEFKEDLLLENLRKLEHELGREINYTFFTEEEWQSKQRSKDSFITGLLKNKRIELIHEKDWSSRFNTGKTNSRRT